jgi:histidine triad (HIT) family protein
MKEDCIFCKISKGEIESKKVYEDDNFIGILDVNPVVEGHTLIIPRGHYKKIFDLPSSLGGELLDAIKNVSLDMIKEGKAESVNLAVVGEDVDHCHVHVIPRKEGDGVKIVSKE